MPRGRFVSFLVPALALVACANGDASPGLTPASDDAASDAEAASDVAVDTSDATTADTAPEADAGSDAAPALGLVSLHASTGWQIYSGGGYRYGPSIVVNDDGSIEMFTCSPGDSGAWDVIRHRHSTDGGHTWTPDTIALRPTAGSRDAYSTCDPGALHVGAYWYVGYTSTENAKGTQNHVYVARATSPDGPYQKWNGSGWGGNPQPIVTYTGPADQYGAGEPSLVYTDKLYVYYTWEDGTNHTDLAVAPDPTADDWPAKLVSKGHVITRRPNGEDSTDIKWVDGDWKRFVGVTTYDRFGPNSTIGVYESFDGMNWKLAPYLGARARQGAHNAGISGDGRGHIDPKKSQFVAYAYAPAGSSWGDWPTFIDPITLAPAPKGAPVGGGVSSIVGTNDWNWSGPRAWDGDEGTVFSSVSHGATADAEEWAFVDLGEPKTITGVTLVPRAGGLGFPVDFSIQSATSLDAWTDVPGEAQTAFPNPGAAKVVRTFGAKVTARYLRLHATKLGLDDVGNRYLQLSEILPTVE